MLVRDMRRRIHVLLAVSGLVIAFVGVAGAAQAAARPTVATTSDALSAVSCTTLSRCWAVGYAGANPSVGGTLVERWDRRTRAWVHVASPSAHGAEESNLNDISCPSSSSCVAVGAKETSSLHVSTLSERWDGRAWSMVVTPHLSGHPSSLFWGVNCPAVDDCWAVGSYVTDREADDTHALIEHYDGSTWSVVASPNRFDSSVMYKVSCASTTSCLAVGDYVQDFIGYAFAEHWNGSTWSLVFPRRAITSESAELLGVSCITTTTCISVGNYALEDPTSTLRTLAAGWAAPSALVESRPANPSATDPSQLISDDCPSAQECVAVGDEPISEQVDKTVAEQWNGSTWSIVATPQTRSRSLRQLDGVSCPSATDCFAVGFGYAGPDRTLAERWTGGSWAVVPSANP